MYTKPTLCISINIYVTYTVQRLESKLGKEKFCFRYAPPICLQQEFHEEYYTDLQLSPKCWKRNVLWASLAPKQAARAAPFPCLSPTRVSPRLGHGGLGFTPLSSSPRNLPRDGDTTFKNLWRPSPSPSPQALYPQASSPSLQV